MPRRMFLRDGGLALLALGLPPEFVTRALFAGTRGAARRKTVICVFQRGAVDGLSMVVPFGEAAYYRVRGSTGIAHPRAGDDDAALDLDGFFGLHPALAPLLSLWTRGEIAIVHACGSPHPTRSHFEAQDFMETASPGEKSTRDGWLNRLLAETGCETCAGRTLAARAAHTADHASGQVGMAELRGVAIAPELPLALRGDYPALAIPDLERFGVAGGRDPALEAAFTEIYRGSSGDIVRGAADQSFAAIDLLKRADPTQYRPRPGVEYPRGDFGRSLQQISQLVKAEVGLEVAFADLGGWDTHLAQGGARGVLAGRLRELAQGLAALCADLGERMADVVVVTMSEFGRTVAENGSGGTDHGHGNCMLVLGGPVAGGHVFGPWPGLEREQLYEGRDLAITTDFRDVFAEVVTGHLGAERLD
ncbi:MAG: DUF1501 domain-containing protein, partial [Gemmatimonadales bacterium]|nr:DUF1501 domain-containing protein [Gemmatimonadales bacterium]